MSKILIANWKMNPESITKAQELMVAYSQTQINSEIWSQVVVSAPNLYITELMKKNSNSKLTFAAQDVSIQVEGSFTGEVSASMLDSLKINNCIVGHSESRQNFGYIDSDINDKVHNCLKNNIRPIICVGFDPMPQGTKINYKLLEEQIVTSLQNVDVVKLEQSIIPIIAYEPIWAIGTGQTPSKEQISQVTKFIKQTLTNIFLNKLPVLYGGSVNDKNIKELYDIEEVDGFLVGGASLNSEKFTSIICL